MIKYLKPQILFSILLFTQVHAQTTSVSGNIDIKMGRGNQFNQINKKSDFDYNEFLMDININRSNWFAWLQYEYSNPPEYGRNLNTLRRFRFNYKKNKFNIGFGDIYRSWDRGLILSQYDDQPIDLDNSIRGLGIIYNNSRISLDVIGGFREQFQSTPFNSDLRKHDEKVDHKLVAGRLGVQANDIFGSISFLLDNVEFPMQTRGNTEKSLSKADHYLGGLSFELNKPIFDISFDAIYKYTNINPNLYFTETDYSDFTIDSIPRKEQTGYSIYSISNLYLGNWTLSIDYKKYALAVNNPDRREVYPYPEGSLIYQNPPLTFYEHSSTLLNRNIHQMDKSDEVGYQISLNGLIGDNINLLLNYSRGSRNIIWSRDHSEIVWQENPWEEYKKAAILPLNHPASNPFSELFGEAAIYALDDHLVTRIGFSYSKKDFLLLENINSNLYDSLSYEFVNALSIPMDISYSFSNGYSIEVKYQWQQLEKGINIKVVNSGLPSNRQTSVYYDLKGDDIITKKHQFSSIIQFGVFKSPKYGINLTIERDKYNEFGINSDNIEINPFEKLWENIGFNSDRTWISAEILWNISSKYRLNIFYGSEKGGLQCRNGVCKIIQPFSDGFRVGFATYF